MLQEAEERREEGRLAAGQDLDVRRMELEAQRRRLEQVILFRLPVSSSIFYCSNSCPSLYLLLKGKTILYLEYFGKK